MQSPCILLGEVVKGTSTGRLLGFPTINVPCASDALGFGVYACLVTTPLGVFKGALHFGPRRVLGIDEPQLEVHLLDFSGDLYGVEVKIEIFKKLRDTMDFVDLEVLKKQMGVDVEEVKRLTINN